MNRRQSLELLESRRLLSFALFGSETMLPVEGVVRDVDVAAAGDGRFILAALVTAAGGGNDSVVAVRYAASGQQLGSPLTIASYPSTEQQRSIGQVSVSMNDADQAIVAFNVTPDVDDKGVWIAHISAAGVAGARVQVVPSSSSIHDPAEPSVSLDAAGGYVVGWIDNYVFSSDSEATDAHNALVRAFDASDHQLSGGATVSESLYGVYSPEQIDVAAKPDGSGAVATVTRYNYDARYATAKVMFQRMSTTDGPLDPSDHELNDRPWPQPFSASSGGEGDSVGESDQPSVAEHDDGSFVIAYRRYLSPDTAYDPSLQAAYAQRLDADGQRIGDPIVLGSESLAGDGILKGTHGVDIAATNDGGFVATLAQTLGDTDTLYALRYDAAGAPDPAGPVALGTRSPEAADRSSSQYLRAPAAVAADSAGRAAVAWIDDAGAAHLRRLSSNIAEIDRSVLYVLGTGGKDVIDVTSDGGNLVAARGGETQTFPAANVSGIYIDGLGGDDKINNHTATSSTLRGGAGRDTVYGGDAGDLLIGNSGNDLLVGNAGADRLFGNGGRDRLVGGAGGDRIYGGESGDWLWGQGGADQLFGEGGGDHLNAGVDSDADTLHGGAGDDFMDALDSTADQLFGDRGHDAALADVLDSLASIESIIA